MNFKKGWALKGAIDIVSDWWFTDIYQLNSVWSPLGKVLYLTLLTDPQIFKGKIVWCVGVSNVIPFSRNHKFINQITLTEINRIDISHFVEGVNQLVLIDK